ncbi:MAG TPA: RNA polymerase sigma factor [Polyangiaceae bacterium]|nr:RNA polymerase sigma factor [Polyangiaceae bacterium]
MREFSVLEAFTPVAPAGPVRGGGAPQEFVERLRRGEVEAVAAAYDEHHAALCSFAKRLLGDDAAAEDLVQDVFVVLPDVVHRFAPEAPLRSFLLGIAANRARHHVRARSRRRKFADRLELEPLEPVPDPEVLSERRRLADRLARALEALPLEQRTTFVLKEIEGYAAKEVADILSIPEATVRTRLFHARKRLRSFLDGGGR